MHAAQRRIGAVERVLRAVVVERDGLAQDAGAHRLRAHQVVADRPAGGERVARLRVDVVAERDDEVEVLARHRVVGVVVAVGEVGARPLARLIQKEVRDPLTDQILFGALENGGTVRLGVANDTLAFTFEPRRSEPAASTGDIHESTKHTNGSSVS